MKKIDVKSIAIKAAATGAGAVAAAKINSIGFIGSKPLAIRGLIKVALGAMLPKFLAKGKKGGVVEDIGNGMMAVGALELANGTLLKGSMASVNGIGELATLGTGYDQIMGVGEMPTLGAMDTNNPYT